MNPILLSGGVTAGHGSTWPLEAQMTPNDPSPTRCVIEGKQV